MYLTDRDGPKSKEKSNTLYSESICPMCSFESNEEIKLVHKGDSNQFLVCPKCSFEPREESYHTLQTASKIVVGSEHISEPIKMITKKLSNMVENKKNFFRNSYVNKKYDRTRLF